MQKTLPLLAIACFAALMVSQPVSAFVTFTETAKTSGIRYTGQSWGASWGDFNGDRWPDLWVSNHSLKPYLYLNNQDGTFTEIADLVLPEDIKQIYKGYDTHGAAWADYDNDGDQDLIQLADGGNRRQANWLLENNGGVFTNRAGDFGITSPTTASRTPTWYDWNNDGLLDLATSAAFKASTSSKSQLYYNNGNGFDDVTDSHGFITSYGTAFIRAIDLDGNSSAEALVIPEGGNAYAFDVSSAPFADIIDSAGLSGLSSFIDSVFSDLNGDGIPDIYAVTGHPASDLVQTDSQTLETRIYLKNNEEKGFDIQTDGDITIAIYPRFKVSNAIIFIGENGNHPPASKFTLSPADIENHGTANVAFLPARHLTVGYYPDTNTWQVRYRSGSVTAINLVLTSNQAITAVIPFGIDPDEQPLPDLFFQGGENQYSLSTLPGISATSFGRNIVAGDFDNDTDDDLYIVRTGSVENLPNILYENNGDGTFTEVIAAAGAEGNLLGRGDTVTTVDYNRDGFLDLFVTNGKSKPPYDKDGPYWLFTNQGNNNNWLEIDLEGVYDNRDGIGARVVVSHQDMKQEKIHYNGTHYRAQNHGRLHFGMAQHKRANIVVYWPNGQVQTVKNVPVNQTLYIQQEGKALQPGKPVYTPGSKDAVYIWRDYWDGNWELRVNGSGSKHTGQVNILSSAPLTDISGNRLEANDEIISTSNSIEFNAVVSIGEDGLSFTSAFNSNVMVSAFWDNTEHHRSILVGQNQQIQPNSGWIINAAELSTLPAFNPKTDAGLFTGKNIDNTGINFRVTGGSAPRLTSLDIITTSPITSLLPVSVDVADNLVVTPESVHLSGWVGSGLDGFDLTLQEPASDIAIMYRQSGTNQYVNVNPDTDRPMPTAFPNAISLPLPEIMTAAPAFDPQADSGVYIWIDPATGRWHVRVTTGENTSTVRGRIAADRNIERFNEIKTEISDTTDTSIAKQIDFNFNLTAGDEDGFSFSIDKTAEVHLMLDTPEGAKLIRIGEQKWPVLALPVRLR